MVPPPSPAGDPKDVSSSPSDHDPQLSSSSSKRSDPKGSGSGALSPSVPAAAGPDGCRSFSQLLAGAMACSPALLAAPMLAFPGFLAPAAMLEAAAMTGPFLMSHQAVLATVTAQAQMRLQGGYQPPFSPLRSVPLQQQSPSKPEEKVIATDATIEKQKQMTNVGKTMASDGYNWRKYGQKPAKQSETLRSYYRCTKTSCSAKKKVAHCIDGRVTEIIYHGEHNHACPKKAKFSREGDFPRKRHLGESDNMDIQTLELSGSRLDSSKMEQNSGCEVAGSLHCCSDGEVVDTTETDKDIGEPNLKRRACENHVILSPTPCKIVRDQKVLVESASNSGLENDGYRWWKYGQKNIKGSPNPRSYYRYTHTGCPARKHVEKASNDSKATIVTYEGKHNHESEPLKSENEMLPAGPPLEAPSADVESKQDSTSDPERPPVDCPQDAGAAAPTEMSTLQQKTRESQPHNSTSGEVDASSKQIPS